MTTRSVAPNRVRRAVQGDEGILRNLRLRALGDAPLAFGSTYEAEQARTMADWTRWIAQTATFIGEGDEGPVGLAAGVADATDPTLAHLRSMWVDPAQRGSGLADELIDAVVRWAAQQGAARVELLVVDGNTRARRCYERLGFVVTGGRMIRERDGAVELEMSRTILASDA